MRKLFSSFALALTLLGAAHLAVAGTSVQIQGLRGGTPIAETPKAEMYKPMKDAPPLPRDFVQQPPLIPHSVRDYQITKNFNKCMDCHAWTKTRESGATKVSVTHFKDRNGQELSNISPRRYFCNQCHVPQSDARPLVANTFKPGVGL